MIVNFIPFEKCPESDDLKKLYNCILVLCESSKTQETLNKAVCCLNSYMQCFSSFIFQDYEKWHDLFNIIHDSCPSDIIVIDALKTFYKIISLQLSEEHKDVFLVIIFFIGVI